MNPTLPKRRRLSRASRTVAIPQSLPRRIPAAILQWESELPRTAFQEALAHRADELRVEEVGHVKS